MRRGLAKAWFRPVPWSKVRRKVSRVLRWVVGILGVLALGIGCWFGYVNLPQAQATVTRLQSFWEDLSTEVVLWAQFIGSILVSLLALSWTTVLLFGALGALTYLLPRVIHFAASIFPKSRRLPRLRDFIHRMRRRRDWLVGTVLNLIASAGALYAFSQVVQRPLDYWDLGIQLVIALMNELIVLGVILKGARQG